MDIYDPHHSLLVPVLSHYRQSSHHVPTRWMGMGSAWSPQHPPGTPKLTLQEMGTPCSDGSSPPSPLISGDNHPEFFSVLLTCSDGETEAEGGVSGHTTDSPASRSPHMQHWALAHSCARRSGDGHGRVVCVSRCPHTYGIQSPGCAFW